MNMPNKNVLSSKNLTLGLIGIGVGESGCLSGLPSDQTVEVWPGLVLASGLDGVALGALLDEDLLSLGCICHLELSKVGKVSECS